MLAAAAPLNRTPSALTAMRHTGRYWEDGDVAIKFWRTPPPTLFPKSYVARRFVTEKSHLSFRVIFEEALATLAGESHVQGDRGRACNDGSLARHRAPLTSELHLHYPGRRITYT